MLKWTVAMSVEQLCVSVITSVGGWRTGYCIGNVA